MTTTPKFQPEESLGESWVDITSCTSPISFQSADRVTPVPFISSGDEYLRLLKEAQRESNSSSRVLSKESSRKGSPKSPPNSPNNELEDDLRGVFINYSNKGGELYNLDDKSTDWIWDWSSRPDQAPPKNWKFIHPKKKTFSMRNAKVGKDSLFSKEVLYTLFLTNILSILLGAGVGAWLCKRGGIMMSRVTLD